MLAVIKYRFSHNFRGIKLLLKKKPTWCGDDDLAPCKNSQEKIIVNMDWMNEGNTE